MSARGESVQYAKCESPSSSGNVFRGLRPQKSGIVKYPVSAAEKDQRFWQ